MYIPTVAAYTDAFLIVTTGLQTGDTVVDSDRLMAGPRLFLQKSKEYFVTNSYYFNLLEI